MFKVFLVDDEPYVIEGLKLLVDWNEMEIEIAGEAADGKTAFEQIKRVCPDIVISDIRMPCMSGIELLENCSRLKRKPKFVMLTGYGEMNYVRQAMKYGARGYLLKPLDAEEIKKTINEVCTEISTERELERENEEVVEEVIRDVFQRLLFGEKSEELFKKARFLLGINKDCPLVVSGLKLAENITEKEKTSVIERMKALLPEEGNCICKIGEHSVFLINTNTVKQANIEIVQAASNCCEGKYIMCIDSMEKLAEAYLDIVSRFSGISDKITVIDKKDAEPGYDNDEDVEVVIKLAMNGDKEQAIEKIYADMNDMKQNGAGDDHVYGYAVALLVAICKYSRMSGMNTENIFDNALLALNNAYDYDTVAALCVECLEAFLSTVGKSKTLNSLAIAKEITDYIKDNYADVTLADISRKLHLTSGIISRTIKQYMGMKYSDYLNFVRLQNAKNFILHTDIKVTQIAVEVGYNDYYYFTKKFKDMTGCLPSDYRKKRSDEKKKNTENS